MDKTSTAPRDPEKTKFRFKEEYIFLTVCASDDVKEAERLLDEGVDINTANVDGLTALHQVRMIHYSLTANRMCVVTKVH